MSNKARGVVYEVTWFQGGSRKRRAFRKEVEAFRHAQSTVKALDAGKFDLLDLAPGEVESFRQAKNALAILESPPPLFSAIQEFVAAKSILGKFPLLRAIEEYAEMKASRPLKPISVPELVVEFLAAKQADGLSERYLRDCGHRLGRFSRDFQTEVSRVKSTEIDAWLRSLKQSGRSRNNFRTLVVTLFKFARSVGHLPRDKMTEAEHVARAKERGRPIEIFTPDEMERLLLGAGNEVLPYLALGAFGGIRTAEILRLTWDCFKWSQKVVEIRAGMAKTAQRRLIPLSDNLLAWLRDISRLQGPVVNLARPEKTAGEIVALSCNPPVKWKRNALRHSYASYRLALIEDAGKLALEMGNSPNMIFRHYRELVTREEAEKWFSIVPQDWRI